MKIYVTKYALTQGITTRNAEVDDRGFASVRSKNRINVLQLYSKKDYALTEEEALKQCEALQQRKIASLEKQLKKIKNCTFKIPK